MNKLRMVLAVSFPWIGFAQQYSIDLHSISGGGGTCVGGSYQMTGTIGQPEAAKSSTGNNYTVTGGFWSMVSAVQSPGAPRLRVSQSGVNAILSWPSYATGYTLQQSSNLSSGNWSLVGLPPSDDGTTKRVTITLPQGILFFRLYQ